MVQISIAIKHGTVTLENTSLSGEKKKNPSCILKEFNCFLIINNSYQLWPIISKQFLLIITTSYMTIFSYETITEVKISE